VEREALVADQIDKLTSLLKRFSQRDRRAETDSVAPDALVAYKFPRR
jgi:hypothetical protein